MKGLLRKDLIMFWKTCRILVAVSALFLVYGFWYTENSFFFVIYPILFGGIIPVTLLSYDERSGWLKTCDALPVSRRTVVDEHYLLVLLCALVLYLLTLAVQAAALLPRGRGGELAQMAALLPSFGLAAPAIMLPVTLRWGVEKGRLVYFGLIGALAAAGIIFFDRLLSVGTVLHAVGAATALLATAAVFAGSWLLSRRIYEKREM